MILQVMIKTAGRGDGEKQQISDRCLVRSPNLGQAEWQKMSFICETARYVR